MWPTDRHTDPARVAVCPLRWCSGRTTIGTPLSLRLLLAQQGAQALDVARHHGQGHIALETIEAMIQTAVQAMDLQGVDGRFHRGVLAAQADEIRGGLALALGLGALALLRQHHLRDQGGECALIGRAVEALVEAGAYDGGEAPLGPFDERDGDLIIGGLLHHLMGEDEAMLVLHHRHAQPELHRHAGLALDDPLGVALEDREQLLAMGDGLSQQDAAADLVDLALGIAEIEIDLREGSLRDRADDEVHAGLAHPREQRLGLLQVSAMGRPHLVLLGRPFLRVLGGGVLEPLHLPVERLQLAQLVGALAPAEDAERLAQPGDEPDERAQGIPQQVEIGGIVHVGLDHEGVSAHVQRRLGTFFYQGVPGADHFLVDPIQDLGGEQAQVVLDGLELVAVLLPLGPVAVAQHLADALVRVGQLMDAVVVGVEPQTQGPQHQDLPLLHAGAPGAGVGLAVDPGGDHLLEDGEHPRAQLRVGVDVLQPPQQLRDVVARLGVELNGADVHLAELQLGVDDLAHGISNDEVQ